MNTEIQNLEIQILRVLHPKHAHAHARRELLAAPRRLLQLQQAHVGDHRVVVVPRMADGARDADDLRARVRRATGRLVVRVEHRAVRARRARGPVQAALGRWR